MASLEEDYSAQVASLKEQINEKIEIINKLMETKGDLGTGIPHVSARSVAHSASKKGATGSIGHLRQMNQRNEKLLGNWGKNRTFV